MALSSQVVNLIGFDGIDGADQAIRRSHVAVMQVKVDFFAIVMRVVVDVVYPAGVEGGRPADKTVHFVTFGKEQLCQVRAVLTGNACNERSFHNLASQMG